MKRSRPSNTSLDSMDQDSTPDESPAPEPEPEPEPEPKRQRGGTSATGGGGELVGPLLELLNAKLMAVQNSTLAGPATTITTTTTTTMTAAAATTTTTTTTTIKDVKGKGKAVAFVDQQAADDIADKLSTMKVLGSPPPTPTVVLNANVAPLPPPGSADTTPPGEPAGSVIPLESGSGSGLDPPDTAVPPNSPASNNDEEVD